MAHTSTKRFSGTVHTVDFGPFRDGSNRQAVANEILDSFKSIGFLYLVNHGMPQDKIDSMFRWVWRFGCFARLYIKSH